MSQVPTATNSIINTKVLTYGGGSDGAGGNSGVCNTSLKIHPKILNNEICYTNVTPMHCAPVITHPQALAPGVATVMNATIQHGVSTGGNNSDNSEQVFHIIPLQLGNVATTINVPQNINELPLAIITKNNPTMTTTAIGQQQTNNGTFNEIGAQVIATTLPVNKNNSNNILITENVGISNSSGIGNGNLACSVLNTTTNMNPATAMLTKVQPPINSVINSTKTIPVHSPSSKTVQRPILPKAVANVSVIHKNVDALNVKPIVINGKTSVSPRIKTYKIKSTDNKNKPMPVATINKDVPATHPVGEILQNKMLSAISPNPPVPVAISMVEPASKFTKQIEPTVAENITTTSNNSDNSNESSTVEVVEKADTVLVIDASTDEEADDEDVNDDSDVDDYPHPSYQMSIRHISNSVVLTKAKSMDNRTNGSSRNISQEPASVVIVKLPNASQQLLAGTSAATTTSNIAIPINEALSLAAAASSNENLSKESTFKVVPTAKLLQKAASSKERPSVVMRSNSITETPKSISPRAAKRSQSLNCNQTAGPEPARTELFKFDSNRNEASTAQRRYSNSNNCDDSESLLMPLKESSNHNSSLESLSSSNELNKENNEITFIELDDDEEDDSFEESNSEESNSCTEKPKANSESKPTATTETKGTQKENTQQQQIFNILDLQKSNTIANITMDIVDSQVGISIMKDKNENSNSKSASQTTPRLVPLNRKSAAQTTKAAACNPLRASQENAKSNEKNDDQVKVSLICNEQITALTPSSLSSASSCPENTPKVSEASTKTTAAKNSAANAQRTAQALRRPPADSNTAAARRVCRDSSVASALSMVSTFDMLNWKEDRIATARGTSMRFELNEFNLLQVHERGCPPRYRIHTPYERPITERISAVKKSEQLEPLLYMCRKCKQHGPAIDFLAPEYCSLECLRRNFGKRPARPSGNSEVLAMKRARKSAPNESNNKVLPTNTQYQVSKLPTFRWSTYLSLVPDAVAAPIDLFLNPFPTGPNPFRLGMKLEAIDPENCSLFCVCTIVHIQGYRLRLTFDGYDTIYDFWVNADSMDIFPPGWCALTHRILQPPRGYEPHKFEWETYLKKTNSIAADKKFFTHLNGVSMSDRNPFKVGMFLEADDLNDTGKLCVASVADVLGERIRVHFDGWDDCYDYWVDINSPYIHPCGWHEGRQQLLVPPEYGNTSFNWRDYIKDSKSGIEAPADFFVMREPIDYRAGMKLEVVDPRNPSLIRPATIIHRTRYRVKIHLDCWPADYTFCLEDDSPDLHPMGWCDATGHGLEPPPCYQQYPQVMPCNTSGCRGIGNVDRNKTRTHATREHCPYAPENWRVKSERTPRVDGKQILRNLRQFTAHSGNGGPVLRTYTRQHNQVGGNNAASAEPPKLTEKPTVVPYRQVTRGRPRNCDRLAAQQQRQQQIDYQLRMLQQKEQQQSQHHMQRRHHSLDVKSTQNDDDIDNACDVKIKIEVNDSHGQKTSSISPPTLTPTPVHATAPASGPAQSPPTTVVPLDSKISIIKSFLCDYGPRLQQNYELWRQNISVDIAAKVQRNPLLWSTAETCAFVDAVLSEGAENAARYTVSSKFYKHDIDGAALLMLQQQDLTDLLQLKMGPAIKLCAIILQLRMLVISKYDSETKKATAMKIDEKC